MNPRHLLQRLLADRTLVWVLAVSAIWSGLLISLMDTHIQGDFWSYLIAWRDSWSHGHISMWRTPLYPLLVGLTAPRWGIFPVILSQWLVMLASLVPLYYTLIYISGRRTLAIVLTLFFSCWPQLAMAPGLAGTESLSASFTIFMAFTMVRTWQRGASVRRSVWIAVWALALFALRPGALVILPGLLIFGVAYAVTHRHSTPWRPLIAAAATSMVITSYCAAFYDRFGTFATSAIPVFNRAWLACEGGFLTPGVEPYEPRWYEMEAQFSEDNLPEMTARVDSAYQASPGAYIDILRLKIRNNSLQPLTYRGWYRQPWDGISSASGLTISLMTALMVAWPIVAWYYRRRRWMPWSWSCAAWWTMVMANIFAYITTSYGEWDRLAYPFLPLVLILTAQMLAPIRLRNATTELSKNVNGR